MSTEFARILSELSDPTAFNSGMRHEHTPFHLASLADCGSPDSIDSPGARFLAGIARDVADRFGPYAGNIDPADTVRNLREDDAHDIADSAVPIYTHERWAVFTDLAAWEEDPSELGADTDDMTAAAGVALYMIAERLVAALAEELCEALDADADADEETADA